MAVAVARGLNSSQRTGVKGNQNLGYCRDQSQGPKANTYDSSSQAPTLNRKFHLLKGFILSLCFLWPLEIWNAKCVLLAVWGELTMIGARVSLSDTGLAQGCQSGPVFVPRVTQSTSVVLGCLGARGLCGLRAGWSPQGHCRCCHPSSCSVRALSSIWLLVCDSESSGGSGCGHCCSPPPQGDGWAAQGLCHHRGLGLLSPGRHLDCGGTWTQGSHAVGLPGGGHTPSTHLNEHMQHSQVMAEHLGVLEHLGWCPRAATAHFRRQKQPPGQLSGSQSDTCCVLGSGHGGVSCSLTPEVALEKPVSAAMSLSPPSHCTAPPGPGPSSWCSGRFSESVSLLQAVPATPTTKSKWLSFPGVTGLSRVPAWELQQGRERLPLRSPRRQRHDRHQRQHRHRLHGLHQREVLPGKVQIFSPSCTPASQDQGCPVPG